jgi:three-Cys-motif partner protein
MASRTLRADDGLPARKSGPWARHKLFRDSYNTGMFSTGMKKIWPARAFIDLMAGPGLCKIESDGTEFDGSPLIALKTKDAFDTVVLVENEQALVDALKVRVVAGDCRPSPVIIQGDCNTPTVIDQVRSAVPPGALTLAFLDLIGLNIAFTTIQRLTAGRKCDLIITFPEMDIIRNALRVVDGDTDEEQEADWEAFFGTPAWRKVIEQWRHDPRGERVSEPLIRFYTTQLATLGYQTDASLPSMRNLKGRSIYRLVFASKDARGIDFWKKTSAASQSGPDLIDLMQ